LNLETLHLPEKDIEAQRGLIRAGQGMPRARKWKPVCAGSTRNCQAGLSLPVIGTRSLTSLRNVPYFSARILAHLFRRD
jgi:hypothetical protein